MACLPPDDLRFSLEDDEEKTYSVRVMERAVTAVDTDLRNVLLLLQSSKQNGPPPGILLSEKEAAQLILSLQHALQHCRQLPLDESKLEG